MLDFYTRLLGLVEERRLEAIGLIQLRVGRSLIDLVPMAGKLGAMGGAAPGAEGRNVDHFCLGIDASDLVRAMRWLGEQGVEIIGEPATRYGARGMGLSIYVRDPEGNVVELKQMPPGTRA